MKMLLICFRPRLLAGWLGLALVGSLVAQPAGAAAVPEAADAFGLRMARVVESHPDVIAAKRQLDAAGLGIEAARAGYFPRLSLDSSVGRDREVTNTNGDTSDVSRRAADLTLRQSLYTGGRLTARVDAAETEQSQLKAVLRQVRQKVALEALSVHLQVSRSALLLSLASASERATLGLQDVEQRRLDIGGGTRSDVDFARTRLALAKERTHQYTLQLDESLSTYRVLFDDMPDPEAMADLSMLPRRIPSQLDAAIEQALANHPDLRVAQLAIERARHNVTLEQSQTLPAVELVATRHLDSVAATQAAGRTDSTVGLRVSYGLYSGGESRARVGAANARVNALTESLITARRNVDTNVRIFHRRLAGTADRIATLQQAADDAQQVFAGRARLREFGRETAVAVLDAQLEYNNVLISLVNAIFDSRQNAIRMAGALGALGEESGVAGWFADFVDRDRPLDRLRERIRSASTLGVSATQLSSRPVSRPDSPPVVLGQVPIAEGLARSSMALNESRHYELRLTTSLPAAQQNDGAQVR